jgi:hypothetical protein
MVWFVSEAVALADRIAERDRVSIGGSKQREREQRQDRRAAQQLARRERS